MVGKINKKTNMAGSISGKVLKKTVISRQFGQGLLARLIFTAHATMCVYQVAFFVEEPYIWFFMFLLGAMYVEFIFVAVIRKGKEWKWFFSCVLCYLLVVIPVLWILELDVLYSRLEIRTTDDDDCGILNPPVDNRTIDFILVLGLEGTGENWSLILQQLLIFVLIMGRWILPRGKLTNNEHSQLLLVYVGSGADILEFAAEGLRLDGIRCNKTIIYAILVIWTGSLFQFTLPLTKTARNPVKNSAINNLIKQKESVAKCCGTEIWAILVSIVVQDGPFLGVRLYLLLYKKVINELLLFFTCKNILTIVLQLKRMRILFMQRRELNRKRFDAVVVRESRGNRKNRDTPENGGVTEIELPESTVGTTNSLNGETNLTYEAENKTIFQI
ncbi:transmembrane protein 26-like [Antedon mediterranea]|uniref:transmembrane protein 26-like n=1 Tax=Antedon mediterranea TaxID=105859 RepID=UPI003AF55561